MKKQPSATWRDSRSLDPMYGSGLAAQAAVALKAAHKRGDDESARFLHTDDNELAFRGPRAFSPRTVAWNNLKRELLGVSDDRVWENSAGTLSEAFAVNEPRQIAMKVIDDRYNELLLGRKLGEVEER